MTKIPGLAFMNDALARLDVSHQKRQLRSIETTTPRTITIGEHELVNFCSNDYLGLAHSTEMAKALSDAARDLGSGAGASRLVTGNSVEHERLESQLAVFHGTEAALVFGTGYQANLGVLSSIAERGDVIVSDALNHASIIDGCRLSRATVEVYPHCDVETASALLAKHSGARRRILVTESIFSMDGDVAPVAELSRAAQRHGAAFMVDEAHAVGVYGNRRGVCADTEVVPDILVATLGKSFGCFGAYVCGVQSLREYLVNSARSFVFTTGLPPALARAARNAVELVAGDDTRYASLRGNIALLAQGLTDQGQLRDGCGHSAIFPIIVEDEARVMALTDKLMDAGLFVQGIRPPTVPSGTSRLRITISAAHSANDIRRLLVVLDDVMRA